MLCIHIRGGCDLWVYEYFHLPPFKSLKVIQSVCWFILLQTVMLFVMGIEAFVVLIRQQSHLRITRALRPIFFIDNYLMLGVRRLVWG